jgi:hypothetical protein
VTDSNLHARTTSTLVSKEVVLRAWAGFSWLRTMFSGKLFWIWQSTFGYIGQGNFLTSRATVSFSRKGLFPTVSWTCWQLKNLRSQLFQSQKSGGSICDPRSTKNWDPSNDRNYTSRSLQFAFSLFEGYRVRFSNLRSRIFWFSSVPVKKFRAISLSGPRPLPSTNFPLHHSQFSIHSMRWNLCCHKEFLNKLCNTPPTWQCLASPDFTICICVWNTNFSSF